MTFLILQCHISDTLPFPQNCLFIKRATGFRKPKPQNIHFKLTYFKKKKITFTQHKKETLQILIALIFFKKVIITIIHSKATYINEINTLFSYLGALDPHVLEIWDCLIRIHTVMCYYSYQPRDVFVNSFLWAKCQVLKAKCKQSKWSRILSNYITNSDSVDNDYQDQSTHCWLSDI